MSEQKIMKDLKDRMEKVIQFFHEELASVRTSRANPSLVENIMVEYYGSSMKLKELAGITTPEARIIMIQPWDVGAIDEVMKALSKNDLGLVPHLEGKHIRIVVPELSEERRNEFKKLVKNKAEEARVSLRNIRREMNEVVKKTEKDGQFTEDDRFRVEKEVQSKTDEYIKKVDEVLAHKEKELTQV
jgi:ribosome recycling factor